MISSIRNRILPRRDVDEGQVYEYCPRCDANITLQKGYRNDLPYWNCLGCGEMLINPAVDTDTDIAWICDRCGEMLNIQPGFSEKLDEWVCTECGYTNRISEEEIYGSEDEYHAAMRNPYRGLSDEDVLELSQYREIEEIGGRPDIILTSHVETGEWYVKKLLGTYDRSIYGFLLEHPVSHMPRIVALYESDNCLIVIEEYIGGRTLADLLEEDTVEEKKAVRMVRDVALILKDLHGLEKPIIHRDIKPSNIILSTGGEIILLDMNAAKWYDPDKTDDTRYMGTQYFAAPEQAGYGFAASSEKTDIYAIGILINVLITGKIPKHEKAGGRIWGIIEHCICLESKDRYSTDELISALDRYMEEENEA